MAEKKRRSCYTVNIKVVAEFDPAAPKEAAKAMEFIGSLSEGALIPIPEGVKATVTAETPRLSNHKE